MTVMNIPIAIHGAPENLTVFENKEPACPLCGASILTVIVHCAVWSLVETGMYLSVLINLFTLP
jgi:hypothetical protein